jgi:hypothetical protein
MLNIIKIDSNSWVGYEYEAISFGSQRLNPNLPTQGESRLMAFLMSRVIDTIDNSLNRLDATKRQGESNDRDKTPRSGKLTDYTIRIATGVTSPTINRIKQLAMLNAVMLIIMALKVIVSKTRAISPLGKY